MSQQKTEAELAKAQMVKVLRTLIRLKHSLEAEAELNVVLPRAERAFDSSLQYGTLPGTIDLEVIAREMVPK